MNWLENSHAIVAALIIGAWLAGFSLLVLRKRARDLDWISFSALALFAIGIAIDLFFVDRALGGQQKIWTRGWIGPRDQSGAITIGIIEDTIGLSVTLCVAVIGALFSLNRGIVRREPDSELALSGLLMSVAGVAVAWLSLTPWLSILGLALTTLGGIVLLGAKPEPGLISRFGRERMGGVLLGILGAAVLAGDRHALLLSQGFSLSPEALPRVFDWIGGILLVTGLYLHLHPFPFLGWLSRAPRVSTAASVVVCQIFPAIACFGLMIRFEPELRSIGVFSVFEWVALASSLLAAVCGLAQPSWNTALPLWISSSLAFAFAALGFSGGPTAFALLVGVALSGSALSVLACAGNRSLAKGQLKGQAKGQAKNQARNQARNQDGWLTAALFAAVAPGTGLIGFVGSGGLVALMSRGAEDPAKGALLCLAMICCNLLLWKTVFSVHHLSSAEPDASAEPESERNSWFHLLSGWILIALSLGLLWTGTLTGGVLPGNPDQLFPSWMAEMFGARASLGGGLGIDGLAQGLYWAGIVLPIPFSFWLFGRKQDLVIQSLGSSPRLRGFLESGYAIDRLEAAFLLALRRAGEFLEHWISEKISTKWLPFWSERALRAPARWISETDRRACLREERLARQWTEVPAKALQLVQNGDVQWYLFFAIGSIVAVLIHFLGYSS